MNDLNALRETVGEMLCGLRTDETFKQKLLFRASAVESLSDVADEMLSGVHVSPALRHRVLVAAERHPSARKREVSKQPGFAWSRVTPVVSMAAVATLMIGLGLHYAPRKLPTVSNGSGIYTAAAGTTAPASLGSGTLFAGEGANPPLIGFNGRFYRMLNSPLRVSNALVGDFIADLLTFTNEPSSVSAVGVSSNILPVGTKIYQVKDISVKTALIAEVDGALRVFQRVGYAGSAMFGEEMFVDTLSVVDQVSSIELSGVGTITDPAVANDLFNMLLEFAVYTGSELPDSGQYLTIRLTNGLAFQCYVQDDLIGACGAWACPEFFDMFNEAIGG